MSGTGYEVDYTFNAYNKNSYFSYDSMGNVTADGICTPTPCWSYDYAGHLTAGNGASYLYDALGRRQQKTDAGGTVHSFVFDGDQPYTEFTPSFTRQTGGFYTYANGTTYFNRTDHLGTPRLSTDYTGAVARTEGSLMGPFGDNFTETLSTLDFTGFAGGFWDSENNGEHFGAREYHDTHGSWLSPDPAGLAAVDPGDPQTWNRYAYVRNRPTSRIDPSGMVDINPGMMYAETGGSAYNSWADDFISMMLSSGAGTQCPNSDCGLGTASPYRCLDVACGYMTNQYAANHFNEWDGVLYSNSEWKSFISDRVEFQREALADAISMNSNLNWDQAYNSLTWVKTQGGNADFSWDSTVTGLSQNQIGLDMSGLDSGGCEFLCRDGNWPSIHYNNSMFHLDNVNASWAFPLGLLGHGLIDVGIGNMNGSVPFVY